MKFHIQTKVFSLLSILLIGINLCYGQDPYLNIQDYQKSVKISFHDLKMDSIVPGDSGRDVFWDFSDLEEEGSPVTSQILSPDSLANAEFPNTNYIEKYSNGSFMAYSREGGQTYLMGYFDPNSKTKITYTLPMLVTKRPLSYGDIISSSYNAVYSHGETEFSSKGEAILESDGHGILRLPHKIHYDVIRVRLTQLQQDSISRFDTINKVKTTIYYWYDRESDSPLLRLSESESHRGKKVSLQSLIEESSNLNIN